MLLDRPELLKEVWQALDRISDQALIGEGRVYGGGLHKLEPRELGNAIAGKILEVLPKLVKNSPRNLTTPFTCREQPLELNQPSR
ncbi:hypothetical protein QUA07_04935 [Microcoleus sp. T3_A4]|uniref:hypothetical protein n=1 Tax=Microcoleus sp. T3_A4 TaxID=2818968 RepID=UPI002FD76D1F